VVTAGRFRDIDLNVMQNAKLWDTPVVFIRNKIDIDLKAYSRGQPDSSIDECKSELRKTITADVIKQLTPHHLQDRSIYLLSAWRFTDSSAESFDEVQFISDIVTMAFNRRNSLEKAKL